MGIIGDVADIIGAFKGGSSANKQMASQYEWQRRLNQTAIQDRVADANAAGIHPLYALGSSVQSGGISMPVVDSASDRFHNMGQGIERALGAGSSLWDKAMQKESIKEDVRGKKLNNQVLENQVISSRLALANQAGNPPPRLYGDMSYPRIGVGETFPESVQALDENRDSFRVYNTNDMGDNEIGQAIHAFTKQIPDQLSNVFSNLLGGVMHSHKKAVLNYYKKFKVPHKERR